jgi:hypothetical protein
MKSKNLMLIVFAALSLFSCSQAEQSETIETDSIELAKVDTLVFQDSFGNEFVQTFDSNTNIKTLISTNETLSVALKKSFSYADTIRDPDDLSIVLAIDTTALSTLEGYEILALTKENLNQVLQLNNLAGQGLALEKIYIGLVSYSEDKAVFKRYSSTSDVNASEIVANDAVVLRFILSNGKQDLRYVVVLTKDI